MRAAAKINLFLGVGPLRSDGYHDLTTVFQAVSLFDHVTVQTADELSGRRSARAPIKSPTILGRTSPPALPCASIPMPAFRWRSTRPSRSPGNGRWECRRRRVVACLYAAVRRRLDPRRADVCRCRPRLRRAVLSARRYGAGEGRGEQLTGVLSRGVYHWVLAIAKTGLSTPAVFAELDRLRERDNPESIDGPDPTICCVPWPSVTWSVLPHCCTTTCSRRRCRCSRACAAR